jgi:hypothetical protein
MLAEQFDDDALNNYMERRKTDSSIGTRRPLRKTSINREIGMLKILPAVAIKTLFDKQLL